MSEYRKMARLACYVADRLVGEYDRDTIDDMVEMVGWEVAADFYKMYGQIYGADVDEIMHWIFSEE